MKDPASHSRSFNVICSSDGTEKKFLGLGLSPEGINGEQIQRVLWEAFNATPTEKEFYHPDIWEYCYTQALLRDREKSQQLIDSLKDVTITWEEFQSMPSRNGTVKKLDSTVLRPDRVKLQALIDAPLDKVRTVYAAFLYTHCRSLAQKT